MNDNNNEINNEDTPKDISLDNNDEPELSYGDLHDKIDENHTGDTDLIHTNDEQEHVRETLENSKSFDDTVVKQSPPMVTFLKDFMTVLFRPGYFWRKLAERPSSYAQILWPHLLLLIFVRSLAGFIGTLGQTNSLVTALTHAGTNLVSMFCAVFILSAIVGSLASIAGGRLNFNDALRFVAYGITPLLFIGFLAVVPLPYFTQVAELIALPYTFYVMGSGVLPMLSVKAEKSASFTGLVCGLLLCLWGLMPTLIPMLITFFLSPRG